MEDKIKQATIKGFVWKLSQQFLTQFMSFFVSIVLARIIDPEAYGTVALTTVFLEICNVIITTGFSSAIIQKNKITDDELSSAFWLGLFTSILLYVILFFIAPFVAIFYNEPVLSKLLRVQSLVLIITALYSVQEALLRRELKYQRVFVISLISIVIHGVIGLYMAFNGYGIWALIIPNLFTSVTSLILYSCFVNWHPSLRLYWKLAIPLFSYSSKILASSLFNSVYRNIKSMIIGKVYNRETLAFFNRGVQFPTLIMTSIDNSMNNVLFSSLSRVQDSETQSLIILRRSMKTSFYVCAPLMIGLAAVAKPLIVLLLTEKWTPAIPYVQIMAFVCLTYPLSAKTQAINAKGYSSVTLKINLITVTFALIAMIISLHYSIMVFAASNIVVSLFETVVLSIASKKYLNYSYRDQVFDVITSLLCALFMGTVVYSVAFIPNLSNFVLLVCQIVIGISIYIGLSIFFKLEQFYYLANMLKKLLRRGARE